MFRTGSFFITHFFDEFGGFACVLSVIVFIAYITFLSSVDRVLKRVDPENRRMDPGQVWLNIFPFFNCIWLIVTVERVGESLRNEFLARGQFRKSESYGKTSGLAAVCLWAFGVPFVIGESPCVLAVWILAVIYSIVYWLQISSYARRLRSEPPAFTPPADEGW
ncbi:MAG TPA: hypothetical protein VN641_17605 [Urbifossiella sp.]|jgi:hypothetical protein|nr:hypothetical protein [Urbifossiella sp.]